ncbi:MAG TPA: SMC-Scp complex subunit ScpB [bacterium]|jgi:segregation and condensation protein B|nr:SMC-Scp complex subunit ScpB [bacterium]
MQKQSLTALLEALVLAAAQPVTIKELAAAAQLSETDTELALIELKEKVNVDQRGVVLREIAGGVQFFVRPEYKCYIERLHQPRDRSRWSQAALETLAIIAYRQPITRSEIEQIRGVQVDSVLSTLQERRFITEVGRKDSPGRPILYGTTTIFLQSLGLNDLSELPRTESCTADNCNDKQ